MYLNGVVALNFSNKDKNCGSVKVAIIFLSESVTLIDK